MGKRGIIIKTLQNNKKLFAATIGAVLLHLLMMIWEYGDIDSWRYTLGYDYIVKFIVANPVSWLIALLLVVGSFVFNLNGKAKSAIICAAASAIVRGSIELLIGYRLSVILDILPQLILIVFLLKQNVVNRRTCVYLTLAVLILPELIGWIVLIYWQEWYASDRIVWLLRWILPLVLVYCFGYSADNDATQQPDAVQKATESSYLEAYKLNRKNGGK